MTLTQKIAWNFSVTVGTMFFNEYYGIWMYFMYTSALYISKYHGVTNRYHYCTLVPPQYFLLRYFAYLFTSGLNCA